MFTNQISEQFDDTLIM